MQVYDQSSKWLIEHHGDAILRLAGVRDIASWRALQAELVQQRRLPDGLLEVQRASEPGADLFLIEVATRLEPRLSDQLTDDAMIVWLDRRQLPEVLTLILTSRGKKPTPRQRRLRSRLGMTRCTIGWHAVELWKLSAEELLQTNDAGIMPWVPVTDFPGPPEPILQRCREVIDERAPESERINLLAVSQVLAGLRYNDSRLLEILGGQKIMIESPVLQEFVNKRVTEARRQDILAFLEARFGTVPPQLAAELNTITDEQKLLDLTRLAAQCPDLDAIQAHLRSDGPPSEKPS